MRRKKEGMTYREYAKALGHTDVEIEKMVDGLFGADTEMEFVDGCTMLRYKAYKLGREHILYVNEGACNTVELVNANDEVVELWRLDYRKHSPTVLPSGRGKIVRAYRM